MFRLGIKGGRLPAVEIMVATHAIRNLIRRGEDHQIYTALGTRHAEGMTTMEKSLADMVAGERSNVSFRQACVTAVEHA